MKLLYTYVSAVFYKMQPNRSDFSRFDYLIITNLASTKFRDFRDFDKIAKFNTREIKDTRN